MLMFQTGFLPLNVILLASAGDFSAIRTASRNKIAACSLRAAAAYISAPASLSADMP